jgi:pimeloyl-ACP methyl ester carboxylesterase
MVKTYFDRKGNRRLRIRIRDWGLGKKLLTSPRIYSRRRRKNWLGSAQRNWAVAPLFQAPGCIHQVFQLFSPQRRSTGIPLVFSSSSLDPRNSENNPENRMTLPLSNSRIRLPLGQVFWREVGQGPILIFLHGSWSDGNQWLSVIEHLSQDYHCFALDLLGFGESERPKLHYSIQLQVECLLQYLDALHLPQVYLIGHSLGGWIAASYALKYLDRVSGLVLLSPEGIQTEGYRKTWQQAQWLLGRPPLVSGILRALLPLARLFGHHKGIEQTLRWQQQLKNSPTACKLFFQRRLLEIQAEFLQEQLEWLKVPTLILQGKNDTPSAIARSQIFADNTPEAQLQIIDRGGHDLPEALPGLVARYIRDFVKNQE